MTGYSCPVCNSFTTEQQDKIANRCKYQKTGKERVSTHRPDLSAELDMEIESEISISAEKEATLLDLSPEWAQPEPNPVAQGFQGKQPPTVQNVI